MKPLHLDPIMVRVALVWLGWTEADLNRAIGRSDRRRVLGRRAMLADPRRVLPGQIDVADVLGRAGVPLAWLQPDAERRAELRHHLDGLTAWLHGGPLPVYVAGPFVATCGHGGLRAHKATSKCRACVAAKAVPVPEPRPRQATSEFAAAVHASRAQGLRGRALWQAVAEQTGRPALACQRRAYRLGLAGQKGEK